MFSQDTHTYEESLGKENEPTIHRVIVAMEAMASKWEYKLTQAVFAPFKPAIQRGLDKLNKYYSKLDNTDVYIVALCKFDAR